MAPDLTEETGIYDAGLDALMRALTGPAEPAELAGEQAVLAMFRSSGTPSAGALRAAGHVAPGREASGRFATRQFRRPRGWTVRLVAAAAVVVCAGMAAAAYTAALPAPMQHLAHVVFQFAGVPDNQRGSRPAGSGHSVPPASQQLSPPVTAAPSGAAPRSSASPVGQVGGATISAAADSPRITAGASVVISGQLTWPGHPVAGVTMTLWERPALTLGWHLVGSVPANAAGNGVITVPVVSTDADFRLAVSGVAVSAPVRVTVVPAVSIALQIGTAGTTDLLTVSAPYAQPGNVVVLEVAGSGGRWTYLRQGTLSVGGRLVFLIDAARRGNDAVRAVLLPTALHAMSLSAPVVVPPPS